MLYITTSSSNDVFLKMFDMEFEEFDITDRLIYRIGVVDDKIEIETVGDIEHNQSNVQQDLQNFMYLFNQNAQYDQDDQDDQDEINEEFNIPTSEDIIITKVPLPCVECGMPTVNMLSSTYERLCNKCWKEWQEHDRRIKKTPDYV